MSKGEKYFREQKEEAQKKHRENKMPKPDFNSSNWIDNPITYLQTLFYNEDKVLNQKN